MAGSVVSCSKGGYYTSAAKNKNNPRKYNTTETTLSVMAPSGEASGSEPRSHAPLSADYTERVRPYIDLIDKLRGYGLDQDVSLPAVAVIGDQSAGKSSTLEAISGIQLPRGSGIVTRCPLVLRLKSTVQKNKHWSARIHYTYEQDQKCDEEIDDPEQIGDAVREAQNRITGDKTGISKDLITLDVESKDVPDLTLIDLPGIVRVAAHGQSDDIGDKIKELIRERINKQETIILAVVPANQDIATTEALKLAKIFDPMGERTLGVITKPDLIDRGTEHDLVAIVNNITIPLTKGYTVVKCRGQQRITEGQSLAEALEEEEEFFENAAHFDQVSKSQLGVKNLSKKLTFELVTQIKKTMPKLKKEVEEKIADTNRNLSKLGRGLPTNTSELSMFLTTVLFELVDSITETSEQKLFTDAREKFAILMNNIARDTPDYDDPTFLQEIQKQSAANRGDELPRFMNYRVCKKLISGIIERYRILAFRCLDEVGVLVEESLTAIVENHLAQFPELKGEVKAKVSELRHEEYNICHDRIDEIINMEKMVFTQDRIFNFDLDAVRYKHGKLEEAEDQALNSAPTPVFKFGAVAKSKSEALAVGHQLASTSAILSPRSTDKKKEAEDLYEMVKAYLEVSVRRLVDYVPLTIIFHLIKSLTEKIRLGVMSLAAGKDITELVYEDREVVHTREMLQKKLERLEKAQKDLVKF